MTKFLTKAALAATVALLATPAMAADTEPFTATARIVSPLTLTKVTDLNFGTITMLPGLTVTGSDVSVGRAGVGGGSDACGASLSCTTPSPASFSVAGSVGQELTVTTSPLAVLSSGANTVAFVIDAPALVDLAPAGPGAGTVSFEIGGTITVTNTTVDGTYTGDVDVTVEYS